MAGEGILEVVGNLTDDPELRYTKNGTPVCAFSVANTPRTKNASTGAWEDEASVYYNCTVWSTHAENVAASLRKGQRVMVRGGVHDDSYTNKDGHTVKAWKIIVDHVGPDLHFATVTVTPARPNTASAPAPVNPTAFTSGRASASAGYDAPPF